MKLLTTKIGRFKLIASLEGFSFLILVGIAVPMKHIWSQPWLVQNLGMIHGIIFLLYLLNIIQNKIELSWSTGKTLLAIVLSIIPFGTFYVVNKMIPPIMREAEDRTKSS